MYATVTDCIARLGAEAVLLLEDVKGAGTPAYSQLESALADASEEIDAYIGARHELPLDPPPRLLVRLCVEIAAYRRSNGLGQSTDDETRRYEGAVRLLKDIAAGKASLGAADPDPPAAAESPGVLAEAAPRVFERAAAKRML